ncbi:hypothetical protein D3C80_1860050 [compost metagenome]
MSGRVSQKVRFEKATLQDVQLLIEKRCEIKVADDLAAFVLKVSQGYNREVLEAIAAIERFGRRMEVGPHGVTMADMAGMQIIKDRHTSQYIVVPEAL